jgi:orotidine-5'-phosphate decarboxylase
MKKKVIVALDFNAVDEVMRLVEQVTPELCRLKVGKELFCLGGPQLVERLVDRGFDVFLDLKFHDIPNTVYSACKVVSELGIWMVNVHCLGGSEMLEAAAQAVRESSRSVLLTGVTLLTSLNEEAIREVGLSGSVQDNVKTLASLAYASGLDGVVCSVQEAAMIRSMTRPDFQLVTPGIRPEGSDKGDQKRAATPIEAIRCGADHLVIGRPITRSEDPLAALQAILDQIANG